VGEGACTLVAHCGAPIGPALDPSDTQFAHQFRDQPHRSGVALSVQLRSDPPTAIRALMVVVDSLDEYLELLAPGGGVAQGSYAFAPGVETRAGHTQLGAHPGDRVIDLLRINQGCLLR